MGEKIKLCEHTTQSFMFYKTLPYCWMKITKVLNNNRAS